MRTRLGRLMAGAVAGVCTLALSLGLASAASADTYIVLYKGNAVPASAKTDVQRAGGTFVTGYDQIGVAIARSDSASFASRIGSDNRVEGVSSTKRFASRLEDPAAVGDEDGASGPPPGDLPNAPATDSDTFSPLQWDMRQIHTPQAHAITGGSPTVVVGDIDTGTDYRHPDLRANISDEDSANCVSGAPVPGAAAADDDNGHGTHTAGTIAAAANGHGIVGVAPNVRIASIKAGNAAGYFFPEAVICSFMWAGDRHLDVTNNSYFADPWEYNCHNDPVQQAIWKAEQRAIKYAQTQGVTVVASAGNDSDDVSHPSTDITSPDYPPGTEQERTIHNNCVVVPLEVSGVVGVSATGNTTQGTNAGQYEDNLKAYYSSYGVSAVDVTAPGGDAFIFNPADFPGAFPGNPAFPDERSGRGQVLSTWPANQPCSRRRQEPNGEVTYPTAHYCYLQGTSMAGPHVAGVAALIVSRYGDTHNAQNGKLRPGQVAALISQTADPQACPDEDSLPDSNPGTGGPPYLGFTGTNSGAVQECQGGPGHNSWYGNGQADALNAVVHASGNEG
jgi:subtilisin family serine protease